MSLLHSQSVNRGECWSSVETECLLNVWSKDYIQDELRKNPKRNLPVFNEVACKLAETVGTVRTPEQCRNKIKKLKHEYYKTKQINQALRKLGARAEEEKRCPFYDIFDRVLGGAEVPIAKPDNPVVKLERLELTESDLAREAGSYTQGTALEGAADRCGVEGNSV